MYKPIQLNPTHPRTPPTHKDDTWMTMHAKERQLTSTVWPPSNVGVALTCTAPCSADRLYVYCLLSVQVCTGSFHWPCPICHNHKSLTKITIFTQNSGYRKLQQICQFRNESQLFI